MNKLVKYRKITSILMLLVLVFIFSSLSFAETEGPFKLESKSAILIDAISGEIIYEKNIHERLSPASITKIMVLLIAMEEINSGNMRIDDKVHVSANAERMGGSQVYLEEGETQIVDDLLKAICLRSANDAAVALAEHMSGSIDVFVQRMNEKAKQLGMTNTHFKNATGLPDEEHLSTAYDISLMSKELLKYPKIHEWLTIYMTDIKVGKNKNVTQTLVNTNRLIREYQGANGLKTGLTNEAGHCLAASAKRGNLSLISVVLGGPTSNSRFLESKKLLDFGFANYDSLPICRKDEVIKKVKVSKGKESDLNIVAERDYSLLVKKGSSKEIEKEIILPDVINAPYEKGQKIGEMILKTNGNEIGRISLIAEKDLKKASVIDMFKKVTTIFLGNSR
ncbi:D-alanyl-D-alanine carboxypeptidase family protein [Proteiniborus sp. MB09-C3]|uniref:D-alanyl-D-alanine carboxypeptidase family protein n=1 Tax=Proteiniborus sp. MB09-C3 TaxID=3050072 RepID=UPI00255365FE|nr:D-alanyl-D-alanine carboxypeptidase family protein [Proteiniborus sp. MB09-C3]WIV10972.1 D-alanyl-D-alanine carboxypeptidase family protein [Proteiniborus sp. MB09-C3]